MNEISQKVFQELENGIKLESSPFKRIANTVGISENDVIQIIKENINNGKIRRIGASVRPDKLEYLNNALVAWQVDDSLVDSVGEKVASYNEVTHCYERECPEGWDYNFYTMIHAKTEKDLQDIIEKIKQDCKLDNYSLFKTIKELKKTSMKYF